MTLISCTLSNRCCLLVVVMPCGKTGYCSFLSTVMYRYDIDDNQVKKSKIMCCHHKGTNLALALVERTTRNSPP